MGQCTEFCCCRPNLLYYFGDAETTAHISIYQVGLQMKRKRERKFASNKFPAHQINPIYHTSTDLYAWNSRSEDDASQVPDTTFVAQHKRAGMTVRHDECHAEQTREPTVRVNRRASVILYVHRRQGVEYLKRTDCWHSVPQ